MRRLHRPAVTPPTLDEQGIGGRTAASHIEKRDKNPTAELVFHGHWNEADVRGALHAMQGFSCAYCQRKLDDDERGEVDHYRPKGGGKEVGGTNYWWLAYSFENYFLSCRSCNSGSCKRDRFPLALPTTHCEYHQRNELAQETRLFVHPVDDPVDKWMRVAWMDDELDDEGHVKVCASCAKDSDARKRSEVSIEIFRLNKNVALVQKRIRIIQAAFEALRVNDRSTLHRLVCRYLPHGAAAYSVISEVDALLLPTPREELLIFLNYLRKRLFDVKAHLRRSPNDKPNQRIHAEALWSFAVLWKDPPPDTLTSKEIGQWFAEELGGPLKAEIETLLGQR